MATYTTIIVLLAIAGYAAAATCGTSGRTCIADRSECIGNTCFCKAPWVWGEGDFQCYRQNTVAAESKNDVQFTTFNNETVEFPFPCRYLLTHVRQELKAPNKTVIGQCEFKIFGFNKRFRGKIVTHGFDIATKINYDDGREVSRSVRKYGISSNGDSNMTVNAVHFFRPNGAWVPDQGVLYEDAPLNIKIDCFEEEANAQFVYQFRACGLEVTFVPYDVILRRDQPQVAGLSVGINCAHHPEWLSNTEVIGLAPAWQGGYLLHQIKLGALSKGESLVDRAFRQGAVQNQPQKHPSCDTVGDVLDTCNEAQRNTAYASCYWMLHEARFIRCVHDNGLDFVKLFEDCVDSKCGAVNPAMCNSVRGQINTFCSGVSGIQKLTDFINGALC